MITVSPVPGKLIFPAESLLIYTVYDKVMLGLGCPNNYIHGLELRAHTVRKLSVNSLNFHLSLQNDSCSLGHVQDELLMVSSVVHRHSMEDARTKGGGGGGGINYGVYEIACIKTKTPHNSQS